MGRAKVAHLLLICSLLPANKKVYPELSHKFSWLIWLSIVTPTLLALIKFIKKQIRGP